jgi:hypothetical protein
MPDDKKTDAAPAPGRVKERRVETGFGGNDGQTRRRPGTAPRPPRTKRTTAGGRSANAAHSRIGEVSGGGESLPRLPLQGGGGPWQQSL